MSAIHIREVQPETLEGLKRLARMHRRSLQGELHVILDNAARLAPAPERAAPLRLVTARTAGKSSWRREEIYGSEAR